MTHPSHFRFLLFLAAPLFILGCHGRSPTKLKGDDRAPNLRGDVVLGIKDSAGNSLTACSGTIISRRLVLTAVHCIRPLGDSAAIPFSVATPFKVGYEGITESTQFVASPGSLTGSFGSNNDIAVIVFGVDLFPASEVVTLSTTPPELNDQVHFVGYGTRPGKDGSTRHVGTNTVAAFLDDLSKPISIKVAPGDEANMMVRGDSGGGLYDAAGNLIGVAHRADPVGRESVFVNITDVNMTNYLQALIAAADPSDETVQRIEVTPLPSP